MRESVLLDHFPLLVLHASILAAFLSILWRDGARERRRLFAKLWVALVGGALASAWVMEALARR